MATKASGKKTVATRRRRERKNIERGAAHIQSTFNNTIVTITDTQAMRYPGQARAKWASVAPENPPPLPHRPLLKQLPRLRWSTA